MSVNQTTIPHAVTRIAADIGGTFTDIAALAPDGRVATCKLPSTPHNYADAVTNGVSALMAQLGRPTSELTEVLHGCTVATNAILEGKGATTALLTTRGFRDVLELRRVRVPALYDPLYQRPPPLVPRQLRFEVTERVGAGGELITALDEQSVRTAAKRIAAAGVQAVAVCYLHSYANPSHERRTGELLRELLPQAFISLSIDVLPQKLEYERTSTTVINAYVGPPVKRYMGALIEQLKHAGVAGRLMVMQSGGGILDAHAVARMPARIVECGPAAGVIGAQHLGALAGYDNLITLDIGGTTAKASLIENGRINFADEYEVGGGMSGRSALMGGGGYALKLPVIDICEVGAGGGSIAWLDKAGSLKVGPHSAGAVPGPVCYGAGNTQPTVTDANVILGYLNPHALAGGTVTISATAAHQAIYDTLSVHLGRDVMQTAYGIHTVANANMMKAVKAVTTYRGRDPRNFALIAFGGSGGVHAVELARVLQIPRVIVPNAAGVFSAVGLLFAPLEMNETTPFAGLAQQADCAAIETAFIKLREHIAKIIGKGDHPIVFVRQADVRFSGQAYELTVSFPAGPVDTHAMTTLCQRFEAEHLARYGHAFAGEFPVELVNLRLIGRRQPDGSQSDGGLQRASERAHKGQPLAMRAVYFGNEGITETPVVRRHFFDQTPRQSPFIIEEYEGTAVVPPGCEVFMDAQENIIIELPTAKRQ